MKRKREEGNTQLQPPNDTSLASLPGLYILDNPLGPQLNIFGRVSDGGNPSDSDSDEETVSIEIKHDSKNCLPCVDR